VKPQEERIYFFSPFCILRNSTNRIFDMRMCDAFAGAGAKVVLTFPYFYMKENLRREEIFKAYGCKNKFELRMQRTPLSSKTRNAIRTFILFWAFTFSTLRILIENAGRLRKVVFVSRETIPLLPVLLLKKIFGRLIPVRVVIQLHELKEGRLHRWVYRHCSGLMPNVPLAGKVLHDRDEIPGKKILVMNAPMVDFSKTDVSKEEARKKINYKDEKPLVVYTGKIGMKVAELNYLIDAASMLPEYIFKLTGGTEEVIQHYTEICRKREISNLSFTGFLSETTYVRYYQLAADVLVSYYNTKDHLVDFNYPQKIQEYISTHNPLVTPDFGATREVISGENAFIVEPHNAAALAGGIKLAVENKELSKQKAAAAFAASRKTTFDYRVNEFLSFFSSLK
jgi:glycosyltransferase involved in cell wall biosynthesis